ncbi:Mitotic checkpoint protein MAD1 [Klebsormidium nitens]|uniref:Mitotic checkpoint protein MAD1 n=1 Tax=Klebsormidium nitens TaxID=105231 RepID=A0A0U9HJ93_KLENI|nr:Mitotic checkpoint protein MAD1 [Klebsormidium nitens]|eukprot:GAQ81982.1 Mitotic checkpoint protein MAD1 [Klebsormidium nitens]
MLARSPPPRKRRPLQPLFFDSDAREAQAEEVDAGAPASLSELRASTQKRQRLDSDFVTEDLLRRNERRLQTGTPLHSLRSDPHNVASTSKGATPFNQLITAATPVTGGRDTASRQVQRQGEGARWELAPAPQNAHNAGLCCTYECTNMVKREVLELLEEQRRALSSFKQELATERRAREDSQAENASLVRKVRDCRAVIASAEAREAEIQRMREEEMRRGEERWRGEVGRVTELQRLLDKEINARGEAEAAARSAEARATAMETGGDQAADRAEREIRSLKAQLERAEDEHRSALTKADMQIKGLRIRAEAATAEADTARAALDETRTALQTAQEENASLETALARAHSQASSSALRSDRGHELEILVGQLQAELAAGAADVADARRLKDTESRVAVLRERLATAEGRAERAEAATREYVEAKEKIRTLEGEIRTWEETARQLPGVVNRGDLATRFEELQKEALTARAKEGDFLEEVARLRSALTSADTSLREAQSDKAAAEGRADDVALALRRAERKVALLVKERDGLKAILASYEEEEALDRSEQGKDSTEEARAAKAKIQQLETEVAAGREREKELEANLAEATGGAAQQRQRADGLQKELDAAARRNKALEREMEQLGREVALLESRVGKGDYNRATTKVLHLALNPEVEARRTLAKDSLEAEVEELRAKVKQLEEEARTGSRSPGEDHQVAEATEASAQVAALTNRVNAMEKRENRYKQVFADKIAVFRQACTHLFGYGIEMSDSQDAATGAPIATFTITSIYADDEEDRLMFQYREGTMDMLATDFSRTPEMVRQVNVFLDRFKSIPALTANLTVELFNKHTVT